MFYEKTHLANKKIVWDGYNVYDDLIYEETEE